MRSSGALEPVTEYVICRGPAGVVVVGGGGGGGVVVVVTGGGASCVVTGGGAAVEAPPSPSRSPPAEVEEAVARWSVEAAVVGAAGSWW